MFTKTLSKFLLVVVIVTIALLTVSFAASPKDSQQYQDYAQRHPGGIVLSAVSSADNQGADYYQRHRSELLAARPLDTTEYFFRHPQLSVSIEIPIDTTDYFFRHLDRKTPSHVAQFSEEQIRLEYILGERYGVTPQEYDQQALREYWLGERYGQTP